MATNLRYAILFLGLSLILAACSRSASVCSDGSFAEARELCPDYGRYVQDFSLTLDDLPDGYFLDDEETGQQLGEEISADDLARGWQEGYFCGFVKPNEEKQVIESAVYCFVSRYDPEGLVGIFNQTLNESVTPFDAPRIGDDSRAYYSYDAANDITEYTVEFVKKDIYGGITIQKQGQVDLGKAAVEYTKLIESRIP